MRKLKRSECAVLPLVLKRKWYCMIASGEKREEYRDYSIYWRKRIGKWENTNSCTHPKFYKALVVAFSLGYRKPDMFFRVRKVVPTIGAYHENWGEPEKSHYTIVLGERVMMEA